MDHEEKKFTEVDAHRLFAGQFNGKTWDLLEKKDRTREEDREMLDYAHASLAHWRVAGQAVHHQRGEWLIARVHAFLGNGEQALEHARRAFEIFEAHHGEMEDFDLAFAFEALARAHAILGDESDARNFLERAIDAGQAIQDREDREIFLSELNAGDWHGLR